MPKLVPQKVDQAAKVKKAGPNVAQDDSLVVQSDVQDPLSKSVHGLYSTGEAPLSIVEQGNRVPQRFAALTKNIRRLLVDAPRQALGAIRMNSNKPWQPAKGIGECSGCDLDRSEHEEFRSALEKQLVQLAKKTVSEVEDKLEYTSVGSGSLMQDLVLVKQLQKAGFNQIHVNLIDPAYSDWIGAMASTKQDGLVPSIELQSDDPIRSTDKLSNRNDSFESFLRLLNEGHHGVSASVYASVDGYLKALKQDGSLATQVLVGADLDQVEAHKAFAKLKQNGMSHRSTFAKLYWKDENGIRKRPTLQSGILRPDENMTKVELASWQDVGSNTPLGFRETVQGKSTDLDILAYAKRLGSLL